MDIRVDPCLHPIVHRRTPCAFAPHTPEREARTSVGATFRATRGWARAPATGSPRAKYSDEPHLSPPHRVAELVRKASTHRYLSFDPVTEHIASELRLVLHSDKGKAGVLSRACLDLPSAACPTFHGVRQVYARMQDGLTLPDAAYSSSTDRSAVLDEYGIRIQELCMLARMRAAAANSTAHDAIAVEASMAQLSRSDARQPQQLPKR